MERNVPETLNEMHHFPLVLIGKFRSIFKLKVFEVYFFLCSFYFCGVNLWFDIFLFVRKVTDVMIFFDEL